MKSRFVIFFFSFIVFTLFYSCSKQELFKSEKEIKKELQGSWDLIPIPRNDTIHYPDNSWSVSVHIENWTFDDSKVTIINSGQVGISDYSVHTSISKAEFKLEGVTPVFTNPARVRSINGTWQIIKLDGDVLVIANDQDGITGLTELEFKKKN